MSTELTQYINNRLKDLTNTYNLNCKSVISYYNNLINIILKSSALNKMQQINNIKNTCNANLNSLTNKYNSDIIKIKSFVPKQININKKQNALVIGINYFGTANELQGCINDVNDIQSFLIKKGFEKNNINMITDNTTIKPTKQNILNAFKQLLANAKAGDLIYFFYSGHGSYIKDQNGDEETGNDQGLFTLDSQFISDDELKSLIQNHLNKDATLFAMFDCCFSGSILDLKYQYLDSLNYDKYTEYTREAVTISNVIMISGCNDLQTSADARFNNKANGAMTWAFLQSQTQNQNFSFKQLVKSMRDLLKQSSFDQIPQLTSGGFVDIDKPVFL